MSPYDDRQIHALILDLSSGAHVVFGNAYETLVSIGSDAVPGLLDAFKSPERWLAETEAFDSMASAGIDRHAITHRRWIAKVLGDIGDPAAIEGLISLLTYPDNDLLGQNLRHAVIHALGQLKSSKAIPFLTKDLGNRNEWTRIEASHALNQISEARKDPDLVQNEVDALVPLVRSARFTHLAYAMFTLAEIDHPLVVPVLAEKLADTSLYLDTMPEHGRICDRAAEALERVGSPQALQILKTWRRDFKG